MRRTRLKRLEHGARKHPSRSSLSQSLADFAASVVQAASGGLGQGVAAGEPGGGLFGGDGFEILWGGQDVHKVDADEDGIGGTTRRTQR
jgi:hypothetical protein